MQAAGKSDEHDDGGEHWEEGAGASSGSSTSAVDDDDGGDTNTRKVGSDEEEEMQVELALAHQAAAIAAAAAAHEASASVSMAAEASAASWPAAAAAAASANSVGVTPRRSNRHDNELAAAAPGGPRSRFPQGAPPGAYHVIPRGRAANGRTARTDAEILADSTGVDLPIPSGFAPASRRQSNQTQTQRQSQRGRSSSRRNSNTSVPGAHAIAGINNNNNGSRNSSRRSSFTGNLGQNGTGSGSRSCRGSSDSNTAGSSPAESSGVVDVESGSGGDSARARDVTATAYLVEEREGMEDLQSAEILDLDDILPRAPPFHRSSVGKVTLLVVGLLVVALAVLLGVLGTSGTSLAVVTTDAPTASPTQAPTFDPRPTLEAVQARGVVRCGIEEAAGGAVRFGRYTADMCRGLAAAVLGDPSLVQLVPVGDDDRYQLLEDRGVDVLYAGDSFTFEKLVREPTTGSGLAFSYPYYGAAVVYAGLATYVQCANSQKRHDECSDLSICAVETPEIRSLIASYFPASFVTFGLFPAMEASLRSGTCNVIVSDTYRLSGSSLQDDIDSERYIISDYHISRNLLSSVVRLNSDPVWYDIVEGTRVAGFRSSQMGIYQDITACPASSADNIFDNPAGVSFYNASMCVGNSIEVFQRSLGQVVLSAGTAEFGTFLPIIDAPNFGSLECDDCANVLKSGRLQAINDRGSLDCAVYLDPLHNLTRSSLATLVNVKFCELLGVAIFQGKPDAVNIIYIDEMDYSTFPREYDIVAGGGWETKVGSGGGWETKVGWDLTNAGIMSFSMPYFVHDKYRHNGTVYDGVGLSISYTIDNEDVSLIFLSTAVVIATIYAQRQGISRATSENMPLIHLLGEGLTFMLRDVVAYGGNYDDILSEALASSDGATPIGWNLVIPNYFLAAKTPVLYCDYTGNCPPCTWMEVDGTFICYSVGPF